MENKIYMGFKGFNVTVQNKGENYLVTVDDGRNKLVSIARKGWLIDAIKVVSSFVGGEVEEESS